MCSRNMVRYGDVREVVKAYRLKRLTLKYTEQLYICAQVAQGMHYIGIVILACYVHW